MKNVLQSIFPMVLAVFLFSLLQSSQVQAQAQPVVLRTANGDFQVAQLTNWAVPAGVTSIDVEVSGAAGGRGGGGAAGAGSNGITGGDGGLGATIIANNLAVTAGEILTIIVGGRGRNGNNGLTGDMTTGGGGGGGGGAGGSSSIWRGATPLVIAGFGGGAGGTGGSFAGTGTQSLSGGNANLVNNTSIAGAANTLSVGGTMGNQPAAIGAGGLGGIFGIGSLPSGQNGGNGGNGNGQGGGQGGDGGGINPGSDGSDGMANGPGTSGTSGTGGDSFLIGVANGATIPGAAADNRFDGSVTITYVVSPAETIPTLSQWGLLIMGLLVLNLGVFFVQKRATI